MSQKLLDVLTLGHCSHEFSWPRRSADGHYYQVCLQCATAYNYDWKAMRRTKRVDPSAEAETSATRRKWGQGRKPTWVPRARRLKLQAPLRYRAKYQTTWYEGTIENLSQSGVLFHGAQPLIQNTLVEMIFEMPEEISGQKNSSVLCQGRVTRSQSERDSEDRVTLAASVLDYKFLHQS
jgi:PilZ domain